MNHFLSIRRLSIFAVLFATWVTLGTPGLLRADDELKPQALEALRKSVAFFHGQVASHGGYVYQYSADLSQREGEGVTDADTVWVEPPGTPTVGLAYLVAYERTGEASLREAAKDAGKCLIRGQLESGGWASHIDFSDTKRSKSAYRVEPDGEKSRNNWTTLDDNKTQSAVRFLMRLDQTLKFKNSAIHEAAKYALTSILAAQYPAGGWPQQYRGPANEQDFPVRKASFPDTWPREFPRDSYRDFYTFNDNTIVDTIDTLLLAYRIYSEPQYREAALRGGDFILLAQLPDPQPAWAQQYNAQMQPVWARKFEPPAVSGSESQNVLKCLLGLYRETGDEKFLKPVLPALAYLESSQLSSGKLARFYELRTNRPLFFTKDYQLTYDNDDVPTHYAFEVSNNLKSLQRQYDKLKRLSPEKRADANEKRWTASPSPPGKAQIQRLIDSLDDRGAWVENGKLRYHDRQPKDGKIIASRTFSQNINQLSAYLVPRL